jgi:hypothetical protein
MTKLRKKEVCSGCEGGVTYGPQGGKIGRPRKTLVSYLLSKAESKEIDGQPRILKTCDLCGCCEAVY